MTQEARILGALRPCLTGANVLCAVSGGADSVALLRLLISLRSEGLLRLHAAHFEHGIRGQASLDDRDFVRALCASLDVPLAVGQASVPAEAARAGEGLETCARRLRRAFLKNAAADAGASRIALAHHKDDQAETVLMHLLRGGGLTGASGMRADDGTFLRPLLPFSHAELIEYLNEIGQPWREDETNRVSDTPRNALRNEILPRIRDFYPGAADALARFAAISADEDAFIGEIAETVWRERAREYAGVRIMKNFSSLSPALKRRTLRRALDGADFDTVERVCTSEGSLQLPGGLTAYRTDADLYVSRTFSPPPDVPLPDEGRVALPGVCLLAIENAPSVPIRDGGLAQVLDAEALKSAVLRTRRAGDFIAPLGMGGRSKSLSDYLTDRKLPYPLRDRVPVIARGSEILWAAGVGVSEHARVFENRAAKRLTITIYKENGGNNDNA